MREPAVWVTAGGQDDSVTVQACDGKKTTGIPRSHHDEGQSVIMRRHGGMIFLRSDAFFHTCVRLHNPCVRERLIRECQI